MIWNTSGHLTMVWRPTQAEIQEYKAPLLCPMTRLRSGKWAGWCEAAVGPLVNQEGIQARRYHCAKCSLLTSVAIPKAASLRMRFTQTKAAQGKCLPPEGNIRARAWFLPLPLHAHFTFLSLEKFPFVFEAELSPRAQAGLELAGLSDLPISTPCITAPRFHIPSWTPRPCFPSVELRYGGKHQGMEDRVWGTHLPPLTSSHCTVRGLGKGSSFIALLRSPSLGLSLGVENNTLSSPIQAPHRCCIIFSFSFNSAHFSVNISFPKLSNCPSIWVCDLFPLEKTKMFLTVSSFSFVLISLASTYKQRFSHCYVVILPEKKCRLQTINLQNKF